MFNKNLQAIEENKWSNTNRQTFFETLLLWNRTVKQELSCIHRTRRKCGDQRALFLRNKHKEMFWENQMMEILDIFLTH